MEKRMLCEYKRESEKVSDYSRCYKSGREKGRESGW